MYKERGSVWRRWDLHLHTPGTLKNDQYAGATLEEKWDNFYNKINDYIGDGSIPERAVSVIGITDYLSIDNYLKVVKDRRLPETVKMVIPNVEMRLSITGKKAPVNIHFLFDPEIAEQLDTRFFAKLSFHYMESKYSAVKSELVRLGKALNSTLDDGEALKTAAEQYLVELSVLRSVFEHDPDLKKHTLIVLANGSNDGASGIKNGQADTLRKSVYQFTDAIFSSFKADRDYFLGKKSDSEETVIGLYGSLKPCIHGSDAHCLDKIFEPDEKRYCWIKADTTFEGLLQILYEPEERVLIQQQRPYEKDNYQVIDSITFYGDEFQDKPIYFNDSLNCIIGGKSTGKSLLLRSIAKTIDPDDVREAERNLNINSSHNAMETKALVLWKDGTTDQRRIVYIPQEFLNRIVDDREGKSKIGEIMHGILMQQPTVKEAYMAYQEKIKLLENEVMNSINNYCNTDELIRIVQDEIWKEGTVQTFRNNIEELQQKRGQMASEVDITDDEIKAYVSLEKEINDLKISNENKKKEYIVISNMRLPQAVIPGCFRINQNHDIEYLFNEIIPEYAQIISGLTNNINEIIQEKWKLNIEEIMTKIKEDIEKNNVELANKIVIYENLKCKVEKNKELQVLTEKLTIENQKLNVAEQRQKQLEKYSKNSYKLKCDIISYKEKFRLESEKYCDIVRNTATNKLTGLEFSAETVWMKNSFFEYISGSLNRKNFTSFRNYYKYDLANPDTIEEYNDEFLDSIFSGIAMSSNPGGLGIKNGHNLNTVLQGIFKNWFNIHYIVKSGNDTIDHMSPGKKALVLLEMLISLEESQCPILIDQPEDDLDNRSIYNDLVNYIREKKHNRQIIVVTHNANVVLGADAEEVIIANQDGKDSPNETYRFEYRCGAIENNEANADNQMSGVLYSKGIQTQICDILEGGRPAFEKRRHKYYAVEHS